jgi:tRNA A-37 threonylcarbamoyl transferase component Bud32
MKAQLVLNCTDASSLLTLWWRAFFLAPIWAYGLLPIYGVICGLGGPLGVECGLAVAIILFWLYLIDDVLNQQVTITNGTIREGFRRHKLTDLTSLGTEYKANRPLPTNLIFKFKSGQVLKLKLSRLRSTEYERLLQLILSDYPQSKIDPVLNTLAQCKKVAKQFLSNETDSFVIEYQSHKRLTELKDTFSNTALSWLRFGPIITAIFATPLWITSLTILFSAFQYWSSSKVVAARYLADSLTNASAQLDSLMLGPVVGAVYEVATNPIYLCLCLTALCASLMFLLRLALKPTSVSVDSEGMSLNLMVGSSPIAMRELHWNDLTNLSLVRVESITGPSMRMRFEGAMAPFEMDLDYLSVADRQRLLKAIERNASQCNIDVELVEAMSPKQEHSYTELWLQSLSSTPDRERLQPLAPSQRVHGNRYKVIRRLGIGGQGTAYLCRDEQTYQDVVLKETCIPVFADRAVKDRALKRFEEEASLLRELDHEQIVRLIDSFHEDNRAYLVLEHVEGMNLRKVVEESGAMSEQKVCELALQMCEILKYLHSNSIIHRDFTPDNLILSPKGILKLIDFNVAQSEQVGATGTIAGKHAYLPPEQFRGKATPQSDIYAFGATLHFLLVASDPEAISCSSPRGQRSEISPKLDDLVRQCTQLNVEKRIKDVESIKQQLSNVSTEDSVVFSTKVPEKQALEA